MSHRIDRRRLLGGAAGLSLAAHGAGADPAALRGTAALVGGAPIPKGRLAVTLETPARGNAPRRVLASTEIRSGGGQHEIAFSLTPSAAPAPSARLVARLERADGWLIARGTAPLDGRSPLRLTLHPALY